MMKKVRDNSNKKKMGPWRLFWGFGFVFVAVALILDALGIFAPVATAVGGVSVLAVIAAILLLAFVIFRICKGKIGEIFVPLALIFMMFEKNVAFLLGIKGDIINNWLLLGCAVMLWIGFAILLSGFKKKNKKKEADYIGHTSTGNIGSFVKFIDCDGFKYESIENNLGSYTVHFENVEKYEGGGVIMIENNLGAMVINVPAGWSIVTDIDNSLGASNKPSDDNSGGPVITIKGDNNLGSVNIKYV